MAVISASEPISIPDVLPPLYGVDGILATTLLIQALTDFIKSKRS